ncbi:MAG: PilZ domain-containing protein [Mariprofundaceae bacterium]|nr:PilZ domain-containing protein [Mariprofundaceae bacterium]
MFFDIHEQRRFARFDVSFDVQLSCSLELPDGSVVQRQYQGVVHDISDVGFRMETAYCEDLTCGQHLDVLFFTQGKDALLDPIKVAATVVWLERDKRDDSRMKVGAYLNEILDFDMNIMRELGASAPMIAV